jgi:hypothetical protein
MVVCIIKYSRANPSMQPEFQRRLDVPDGTYGKETTMTTPKPQEPPAFPVTAQPGSRLEELLAMYESAKAEAAEAKSRFDGITSGLKAEIAAACPDGTTRASLTGAPGLPRLRMTWLTPWRFDSKTFKEEQPYLYVKYSKQGGHWDLRE